MTELEQMLGDRARFSRLQEPALKAIVKNTSPILVIIGTVAGKSLLFMLSISSGTNVVVVPLVLLDQFRATMLGSQHFMYQAGQPTV